LDLEHRFYHRESGRITGEIAHLSMKPQEANRQGGKRKPSPS